MNRLIITLTILSIFSPKTVDSFDCSTSADATLKCNLKTLQAGFDSSQLSSISNLELKCSDLLIFESQLTTDHFGHLPDLEKLRIDSCKIRHVPARAFAGLSSLKILDIHSHSSLLMDVDVESFKKVNSLTDLILTHNNIWTLPSGLLCELNNLRLLNLSNNHLMEVGDVGLSSCRISIVSLVLSRNFISTLNEEDLNWITTLEILDISHNQISSISENAFSGVPNLKEVDLSSNQLSSLPSNVFNVSLNLEKLSLQNNSLTAIAPDIFSGLTNLKFLNLSQNAISSHHLSRETFSSLASLKTLDLSYNQLSKLGDDILHSLTSLQTLFLHNNLIHKIDGNAFANQVQLKAIDLSRNKISEIEIQLFASLGNLVSLKMEENELKELNNLTVKCNNVLDLTFRSNLLSLVPSFIRNCHSLQFADLSNNRISEIQNETFSELVYLIDLDLSGNQLIRLENQTFWSTSFSNSSSNLQNLKLSNNRLASIDQAAFGGLEMLKVLNLNENYLDDLNGIFSHLSNLEFLNVSSNKVEWFDFAFLPNSLTWFDISNNLVVDLSNFYSLTNFRLRFLEASNNLVARVGPDSFPESLVHVRLGNNRISELDPNSFANLDNLKSVDLRMNKIEHLASDALTTSYKNVHGRPRIFLFGNPFSCDCYLDWLPSINEESHRQLPIVPDLEDLTCYKKNVKVIDVPQDQFLCPYETHCFDLCMCCDFYACDCRMQCPYGCECEHDLSWSMNVVKCSDKNHTHIPILIPMDATAIHLDGNRLHYIDQQNFLGRQRVQKLFLNSSGVVRLSEAAFTGLSDLRVLHLEENKISELRGNEFVGLVHLRELYLQNNALAHVGENSFEPLISLQVLRLDGNLLINFHVWKLSSNNLLSSISLSENMWSCGCEFIAPFSEFLEKKKEIISDYESVNCVSSNVIREGLRDGEPCPARKSLSAKNDENEKSEALALATILVPASLATVLMVIGFLAVCVFRQSINAWIYGKSSEIYESNNSRPNTIYNNEPEYASSSKLFDVYVSHAVDDSDFVRSSLSQILEGSGGSGKVCLHHRDFPHGAPLQETTSLIVDSSERVVVVLTESYLRSDWQIMKHFLSGNESVKDKIIFLLIEDIGNNVLFRYPDLCLCFNVCPIVRWGAPGFLNHLRYFLPHSQLLTFQRNITLRPNFPVFQPQTMKTQSLDFCQTNSHSVKPQSLDFHQTISDFRQLPAEASPENHTYQTLEPRSRAKLSGHKHPGIALRVETLRPDTSRVEIFRPPKTSPKLPSVCHAYTHSNSSGQQLLSSNEAEEYLV